MSAHDKKSNSWWVFFPLKGFELTNTRHDLKNPMFKDITFVTKKHMDSIVLLLKLNQRMAPNYDHEKDLLIMLKNATFGEDFNTFLAVKRTGNIERGVRESKLVTAAKRRAYEVASLLTITCLYGNKRGETCGLVEQLHRRIETIAMLELKNGSFAYQRGGGYSRMILDWRYNFKMSRSELKKFFHQTPFAGLTAVLLTQQATIGRHLRNLIIQAAIKLADAIHANAISSQLLGAVTVIELLLGEQGDSYEVIQKRLLGLVGRNAIDRYQASQIFRDRHLYVHKGEDIKEYSVSTNAIALALLSLLIYSDTAPSFKNKLEIVQYLDFINHAGRIYKTWNDKEKAAYSTLLRHRQKQHKFAFI